MNKMEILRQLINDSHERYKKGPKDDEIYRLYSDGEITRQRNARTSQKHFYDPLFPNLYVKDLFPYEMVNESGTFGLVIVSLEDALMIREFIKSNIYKQEIIKETEDFFTSKRLNEMRDFATNPHTL